MSGKDEVFQCYKVKVRELRDGALLRRKAVRNKVSWCDEEQQAVKTRLRCTVENYMGRETEVTKEKELRAVALEIEKSVLEGLKQSLENRVESVFLLPST